jgi:hypothetical protein
MRTGSDKIISNLVLPHLICVGRAYFYVFYSFQHEVDMKKDHCTFWPEGDWGHCCYRHDVAFDRQYPFILSSKRLHQ